jgi:hypothetical protein
MGKFCLEFELDLQFDKYIWPIIYANSGMYEILVAKKPSFFEKLKTGNKMSSFFWLGEMGLLSEQQIFDLKLLSFYAGNMDVLYKIKEIKFVIEIVKKNSSQGNIVNDFTSLPTEKDRIILIEKLLLENEDSLFMTFGHDADVMYLFGMGNANETLMQLYSST